MEQLEPCRLLRLDQPGAQRVGARGLVGVRLRVRVRLRLRLRVRCRVRGRVRVPALCALHSKVPICVPPASSKTGRYASKGQWP